MNRINGKESTMSCENAKTTNGAEEASGCGYAQTRKDHGCPCKKRVCLPLLGLVGVAVAVSLVTRARKSR